MRINNSLKNIYIGVFSQIILVLLGFISRKVFLDNLGTEYLGVNGLLTNILSLIGLVEAGIGTSIVYNLYKPLADNNQEKIISLIQMYKKLYKIIAIIVFVIALIIYPLIYKLVKDVPYISVIYFIFVGNNILTYLNAYKWSLIIADQKGYILARNNLIFRVINQIFKILILVVTHNYIIYLLLDVILYIGQLIINSKVVNKKYEYINTKEKLKLDNLTIINIKDNIKSLVFHNIGNYIIFGTDNILISIFIGVSSIGYYSNYTMIFEQISALINPILTGIEESVGNLLVTESKNKNYDVFRVIFFINFCIYSITTIILYNVLQNFIGWWIGDKYLLSFIIVIIMLINFYLKGLRMSILIFKNKSGLFSQDKYAAFVEAIINLFLSIIFVQRLGLFGILLGTTLSSLLIPFWNQPRIVYKHVFEKPLIEYFSTYLQYFFITIFSLCITNYFCTFIVVENMFLDICLESILSVIIHIIIIIILFRNSIQYQYILLVLKKIVCIEKIFRK